MAIIKARCRQTVNMRREQVERYLASGSTVADWCRLNKVSESTLYKWMAYFRENEPDLMGGRNASQWIEVSREELAASTALATTTAAPLARRGPAARASGDAPLGASPCILARVNGVELSVPPGSAESDVAAVMRAAMSL